MKAVSALLAAVAMLSAAPAVAQETTGTITGRIADAQGLALPGATVTVAGDQGRRVVVTDADGQFRVPFLTPGTYTVRAELQGFKAMERANVTASLGQTTTVTLTMEVGGVAETINVTGSAGVIDTTSTTTGAVLSSDFFSRVPIGRRLTDTPYAAPGVSNSGSVGRANPSISGASGLENQYVVDGVNITNTGYGAVGSYSIVFGSLGNATPFDFVQEVQVKTGGYEAEFGQSMGGVVNVVTKSGSNALRGSAFGYARPTGLEAPWKTVQTVNGTVNTVGLETNDIGVEGGLPIVHDKLFFFGAVNPSWETRTFVAPEGFPLESLGEVDRERRAVSYSAKGTWQPTGAHRVDASVFGDPAHGPMGPQRTSSLLVQEATSFSEIDYGGHNQTVRYSGVVKPNWLVEASFARAKNVIEELPSVNEWRVTDTRTEPNIITGGIGFFEAGNDSQNLQYQAKATNVLGRHQIRYGVLYDDVTYAQVNQRTGPTFVAPDGRTTATGAQVDIIPDVNFGQIYRVVRANFNSERTTRQDYWSVFVQDSWRATDRLTVNAGLRYEDEALIGTVRELETLDGQRLDTFRLKNNWAPRVGAVYDLIGDGRSKLYGNYGRFFARIPNDLAARALSGDEGMSRGDYFDAALTQPVPDGTATQTPEGATVTQHFILAGAFPDLIDPETKLSYKDEAVVGFEWEAVPNMNLGVRYIRRNIGRVLEDISPYPAVACDFGVEEACFVDYILTNPRRSTPVISVPGLEDVSFEDPVHTYNAIELTMDRRFTDRWSLLASYRWSRLRGTYEGFFRDDNGQSDPGITSLYDFPTNDPTYTGVGGPIGYLGDIRFLGDLGKGPLPLDRPHQVKVFGSYLVPIGLNVSAALNVSSGRPLTALAGLPPYANDSEIPLTPRGAGFETVDGFRTRSPIEAQVDFHGSYSLSLGGYRRLVVLAEAFNLFNLRRTLDYNAAVEFPSVAVINPDFGTPTSANVSGQMFQAPFTLRIGARLHF